MRTAILILALLIGAALSFQPSSADDLLLLGVSNSKTPSGGGGSVSFVQNGATQGGSSVTSQATTLSGTVGGNLIVVGVGWCNSSSCNNVSGGQTVSSVTSSNSGSGETCTQASGAAESEQLSSDIWYCKNIHGGSDTITVSFSAGVFFPEVSLSEVHGASVSAPLDSVTNATFSNTGVSSYSISTNGNTAESSEFVYSIGYVGGGATVTLTKTQLNANIDQYQISGAAGSYTNAGSWTGNQPYSVSLAAFKH